MCSQCLVLCGGMCSHCVGGCVVTVGSACVERCVVSVWCCVDGCIVSVWCCVGDVESLCGAVLEVPV